MAFYVIGEELLEDMAPRAVVDALSFEEVANRIDGECLVIDSETEAHVEIPADKAMILFRKVACVNDENFTVAYRINRVPKL